MAYWGAWKDLVPRRCLFGIYYHHYYYCCCCFFLTRYRVLKNGKTNLTPILGLKSLIPLPRTTRVNNFLYICPEIVRT